MDDEQWEMFQRDHQREVNENLQRRDAEALREKERFQEQVHRNHRRRVDDKKSRSARSKPGNASRGGRWGRPRR